MAKYILFLILFFVQLSFAQIDPQNQYYKSGKLYSKRYLDEDSLFHYVKYYENGIMKEQLTSRSSSFGESNLISKYKYYSNGLLEQEETRTDSLEYIVYSKKNYNGKGKLRESYKRIGYNYNKIGDERPLLPPTVTKKYYSNGQLELYLLKQGSVTRPVLERRYYRNGQLKYYDNSEENIIKEFYPDNSLKRLVKGDVHNIYFENEFYENGNLSKEKHIENGINIQKTYDENGRLKTENHYSREKGQLLKTTYFEDGHLEYYENAEEQLTKEYHPNHKLKRIAEGDRRNPDTEKTFYENGNLRYEKYKENEVTITKHYNENRQLSSENYKKNGEWLSYKHYYPSGQLRVVYEDKEEKAIKEFYENGVLKKFTKGGSNGSDIEQEFYEDGTIKKEKSKSEKGTTIYKNYHPNGQLSYYDNKDERVKTQFFENGNIKSENYYENGSYVYKVYDEEQNVIKTNLRSLKYAKTVSQNPKYDFERKLANGLTIVEKNDKYGILNKKGKIVLPTKYDFIHFEVDDNFEMKYSVGEIRKNGKDGLINDNGKIIVPLKYDRIDISNSGTYYTARKTNGDYKDGLIRKDGTATRPKYDGVDSYEEIDYAIVERNDKYGLLSNKKRKKLAPVIYDYIDVEEYTLKGDIEKEIVLVERNERYGLRNLKGKKITPVKFSKIEDEFDEYGLAICTISLAEPPKEVKADKLSLSIFEMQNSLLGVINVEGKEVLPFKYQLIRLENDNDFSYFRVWAFQKDSYRYNENEGIYSLDGKEIVPPVFDWADNYVDSEQGLIRVQKTDFYGMYDIKGNELIPAKYDEIQYHTNELFMVRKDGLFGFLDRKGKIIFPPQYTEDEVNTIDKEFFILIDDTNEIWKNVKEFQKK